jgi:hypothetical protein
MLAESRLRTELRNRRGSGPVKNCSLNICSPLTIRWMKTSGRSTQYACRCATADCRHSMLADAA